jgi:hypothetical protein
MPTFTIPLTPVGASVQAVITPSPTDENGRELSIRGILDTGAAFTVIDNSVVQLLGLEPMEKQLIHGITRRKASAGRYLSDQRPNLCVRY